MTVNKANPLGCSFSQRYPSVSEGLSLSLLLIVFDLQLCSFVIRSMGFSMFWVPLATFLFLLGLWHFLEKYYYSIWPCNVQKAIVHWRKNLCQTVYASSNASIPRLFSQESGVSSFEPICVFSEGNLVPKEGEYFNSEIKWERQRKREGGREREKKR